jgi:hypothetical protein
MKSRVIRTVSFLAAVAAFPAASFAAGAYGERGDFIYERPAMDLRERNDLVTMITGKVVSRSGNVGLVTDDGRFYNLENGSDDNADSFRSRIKQQLSASVEIVGKTFEREDGSYLLRVNSIRRL